mmetsp:Transcript_16937/g.49357  ORF Transcript_16937/g.49357 Transcript_16937/m.49357 type:complete len:235 (-) Transcript_16937:203-907(-)
MGFAMAPRESTSMSLSWGRSAASARSRPSDSAESMEPITMFTTSFILVPAPTVPRKKEALPMASRSVLISASSNTVSSPAARNIRVPVKAGPLEPDTGASRNLLPRSSTSLARAFMSASVSVAQSTMAQGVSLPSKPARIPVEDVLYTASHAWGVLSMENTTSHCFTTSAGCSAISTKAVPAASCRAAHFSLDRFHTRIDRPLFMRFCAMPSPMIPRPRNPTRPRVGASGRSRC